MAVVAEKVAVLAMLMAAAVRAAAPMVAGSWLAAMDVAVAEVGVVQQAGGLAAADSEVRVAEVLVGFLAWAATCEDDRAVEAVASVEHGREAAALVVAAWAVAPVAARAAPMAMARAAMEEGKATATAKAHAEVA